MFKKAKYRWQIKSSNRSNQMAGLEAEVEVEACTGLASVATPDQELEPEQMLEDAELKLSNVETDGLLLPHRNELDNQTEMTRKRGREQVDSDDADGPEAKVLCQNSLEDDESKELVFGYEEARKLNSILVGNRPSMDCANIMKYVMEADVPIPEQQGNKPETRDALNIDENEQPKEKGNHTGASEGSNSTKEVPDTEHSKVSSDVNECQNESVVNEMYVSTVPESANNRAQCLVDDHDISQIHGSNFINPTNVGNDTTDCLSTPMDSDDEIKNDVDTDEENQGGPLRGAKSKSLTFSIELCAGDNDVQETGDEERFVSPEVSPDTSPESRARLERLSEIMDPEGMPPPPRPPSTAPRRLTYLERWRCQHLAKAMVDNAINKTLEESGLSPNPVPDQIGDAARRNNVETEGVSHAIRMVGLRPRYSPSSMQRLNPIINRLTQVSENIFSANLQLRERVLSIQQQGQPEVRPARVSPPPAPQYWREESRQQTTSYARRAEQAGYHLGQEPSESAKAQVRQVNPCEHGEIGHGAFTSCKQCIDNFPSPYSSRLPLVNLDSTGPDIEPKVESNHLLGSEPAQVVTISSDVDSASDKMHSDDDISIESEEVLCEPRKERPCAKTAAEEKASSRPSVDVVPDHGLQSENLSTSFILDTAVAFAINEKGLQLG